MSLRKMTEQIIYFILANLIYIFLKAFLKIKSSHSDIKSHRRRDPRRLEGKQENPDPTPTFRSQQRDLSPVFPSGNDCEERTVLEIQSEDQLYG